MTYNDINPCSPLEKGQKKAIKRRSEECLKGDQQSLSRLKAGSLGIPRINSGFLNKCWKSLDFTPNPDPSMLLAPYGQNVHTPPSNCLRNHYLGLVDKTQLEEQYEKLINRCMLHHCCKRYCLSIQRRDNNGKMTCKFNFPLDIHDFETIFDDFSQKFIGKELG
jgi:hypothetical protein